MTEQAKPPQPAHEQHPYPPPTHVPFPPPGYNGGPYPPQGPPGAYMPPFFAYPPQPDGSHPEGAQNGVPPAPFMIGLPPGVVYYPPPQAQHFGAPPANPAPAALSRPKRKQVKMACTNCASACKRCDESRPCERCVKYGISDSCVDGQRKERKKGIKRGPYRRKNKSESEGPNFSNEWNTNSQSPSATATAAIHAVAPFTPEGYYPVYYPPPGAFMPHPPEGQPGPDGSPPHAPNGQPMMPYYIHPAGYPPFPHYPPIYPTQAGPPPPGTPNGAPPAVPPAPAPATSPAPAQAAPPAQQAPAPVPAPTMAAPEPEAQLAAEEPQPQTVNPADTAGKPDDSPSSQNGVAPAETNGAVVTGKKRPKTGKNGEPKAKKSKTAAAPTSKGKADEATVTPDQPVVNGEDGAAVVADKEDASA